MISGTFTTNGTLSIPANTQLILVTLEETNGAAVGLTFGTSPGAHDVLSSNTVSGVVNVAANAYVSSVVTAGAHALFQIRLPIYRNATTVYIESTNWNGASVKVGLLDTPAA